MTDHVTAADRALLADLAWYRSEAARLAPLIDDYRAAGAAADDPVLLRWCADHGTAVELADEAEDHLRRRNPLLVDRAAERPGLF